MLFGDAVGGPYWPSKDIKGWQGNPAQVQLDELLLMLLEPRTRSVCSWTGVSCASGWDVGVRVNLMGKKLSGTVPPSLGDLSHVE